MSKHKHCEAFCLMQYACECGHRETIWNSRDGVTPFGIACPSCGQPSLRHVEWHLDEFAPDHRLNDGQRFFRDGTPDEAVAIIERRLARFAAAGVDCPPDIARRLKDDARATTGEWQVGWPMVDRHRDGGRPA